MERLGKRNGEKPLSGSWNFQFSLQRLGARIQKKICRADCIKARQRVEDSERKLPFVTLTRKKISVQDFQWNLE